MYNARSWAAQLTDVGVMVCQGVYKSAGPVAWGGVCDKTGWFVYGKQVGVLVEDCEGKIFGG